MKFLKKISAPLWILGLLVSWIAADIGTYEWNRHMHAQTGQMTLNGVPNQLISNAIGFGAVTNLAGTAYTGYHCAEGPVTSTSSGTFSQSLTGFTTIYSASANSLGTAATAAGSNNATIVVASTTTVSGTVTAPLTIVLGGLGTALLTTPVTVWIRVCGV